MKTILARKISSFLAFFLLLIVFLLAPRSVFADGMVIWHDPYSNRWDYSEERSQQAFINYEKGMEKMVLSIDLGQRGNDAVWIFPVPADPNKVVIDVLKTLPRFTGEDISQKAKSNLEVIRPVLLATQIYTIPFVRLWSGGIYGIPGAGEFNALVGSKGLGGVEQDVIVYEHLEKEGITSEVITAKTVAGIYDYLRSKNLEIGSGSLPVLNNYIGKDFSFVVSWLSTAAEENTPKQKGVFVTFPAEEMYFPMLLTSVYGSKIVPVTIRAVGHVSPKLFQEIKTYTKTEYFIGNLTLAFGEDLDNFYSGKEKELKYTKIEINAPSKFLTQDLWISKNPPIKTYFSILFAKYPTLGGVILLAVSSAITAVVTGWVALVGLRKKIGKLVLIGLSNCFSILGLLITTVLVSTGRKTEGIDSLLAEIKKRGYFWRRKLALTLILICVVFLLASPLILLEIFGLSFFISDSYFYTFLMNVWRYPFRLLVAGAVLIFSLIIKRIKAEDKYLFEQLKSQGYSTWLFKPRVRNKIVFVPFFSFSFLLISLLIIILVESVI